MIHSHIWTLSNSRNTSQQTRLIVMARPARSPRRYSDSTIQWRCPVCSKLCQSKAGRLRHFRSKHRNTAPFGDRFSDELLDLEGELPQTPVQSHQDSSPSSPNDNQDSEAMHNLATPTSNQNDSDIREAIDINFETWMPSSPMLFGLYSNNCANLVLVSEFILDDVPMNNASVSPSSPLSSRNTLDSEPPDSSQPRRSATGSVNYHPTMNGM